MASCSKEETTEINAGRGIDFRANMGTRAAETTTANLKSFFVTAFNGVNTYFDKVEFSKNGGFFTSSPEYYWPADGSNLSFFAYAPSASDLGGALSIKSSSKMLNNFRPNSDISKQKDFIEGTATGNKQSSEKDGVSLTFKHALVQIGIQAKNGGDFTYNVRGVKIGKVVGQGNYNFVKSEWTLSTIDNNILSYSVEYDTAIQLTESAQSLMGEGGNAMLIPQNLTAWDPQNDAQNSGNGAYLSVLINVTNSDNTVLIPQNGGEEDYIWAAVPIDTEWTSGKKYIYTLDFSNGPGLGDPEGEHPGENLLGEPIKFKVEVGEWNDASLEDMTM